MKLILPTSQEARFTDYRGSLLAGVSFSKSNETKLGQLVFSYGLGLNLANYKYDSSVLGQEIAYSPYGINNSLSLSFNPNDKLGAYVEASVYNRFDYKKNHDVIQIFTTGISYELLRDTTASVSYRWKDKYYSNDSFLDDDKSLLMFKLSYRF